MKRLTWLVFAVVGASAAESRPAPAPRRVLPPFDRNCQEVASAEALQTCIDTHAKGAKVDVLAPDLKHVTTPEGRHYLFAHQNTKWRVIYRPGDANYELVGSAPMTAYKNPARRYDLSHHVALGNNGVFLERVTLVCMNAGTGCQSFMTACTVMMRGRATETFRGELRETEGTLEVVGDRSYAGNTCGGRR